MSGRRPSNSPEQSSRQIHVGHLNRYAIAEPIAFLGSAPEEGTVRFVVAIVVIRERGNMDEAFGREFLGLSEEAIFCDACDDRVEFLADARTEIRQ